MHMSTTCQQLNEHVNHLSALALSAVETGQGQ